MSQVLSKYRSGGQAQPEPAAKPTALLKQSKPHTAPKVAASAPVKLAKKPAANSSLVAKAAKEPAKNASIAEAKPANQSAVQHPPAAKEEQVDSDIKAFELQTSILTKEGNQTASP